jgi:proline dehydrogenase
MIVTFLSLHSSLSSTDRTPSHLTLALADARKNNYSLGVKLVRGAYHPYEIAAHKSKEPSMSISPDELPPVWAKKEETDQSYNYCIKMLINAVREDLSNEQHVLISKGAEDHLRLAEDNSRLAEDSWGAIFKGRISYPIQDLLPAVGPDNKINTLSVGILFGTHNWESSKLILRELVRNGLAEPLPAVPRPEDGEDVIWIKPEAVGRVAIGQLFGACL